MNAATTHLALRLAYPRCRGLTLVEIPIEWHYWSESKIRPVRDAVAMAGEILTVRWNAWRGLYRAASLDNS